jgi:adenosine kinase
MSGLICGSLAYDTIMTFAGRFAQQILPEQIHILNVSFIVPTLKREFGGCAGNIAYALHSLGGQPIVAGALGASDGQAYLERLTAWGPQAVSGVKSIEGAYTAQAMIMTDLDNNQITAFHPGAMQHAGEIDVLALLHANDTIRFAILAPDHRDAVLSHAEQLHAGGVPFVFDPGQQLPVFERDELKSLVDRAAWVTVNDYEARLLEERLGLTIEQVSQLPQMQGMIVTLGHEGCEVWIKGTAQRVPGVKANAVVDPTGCGDAFRGALLWGLEQGWDLPRCAALGNRVGAIKVASSGPQSYHLEPKTLLS